MIPEVVHELKINIETNAFTVKPPLDIHQYDANNHLLLISLVNAENDAYEIPQNSTARLTFYLDENTVYRDKDSKDYAHGKLITTDTVEILNYYRGQLSYLIGSEIVKEPGRVTAYLEILSSSSTVTCECGPSASFVITISKSHRYEVDSDDIEATISQSDKNKIDEVISNKVAPKSVISSITLNSGDNTIKVARYNTYGQVEGEEDIVVTLPEPSPTTSCHYVVTVTDGEVCTCDKEYDEIVSNILSDKIVIFKVLKANAIMQCPMYSYADDVGIYFIYTNLSTRYHIYKDNDITYVERV